VWTSDFLKSRDRDLIDIRISQYQEFVDKEGVSGLKKIFADEKMRLGASRYLLTLSDLSGDVLFTHMPEDVEEKFNDLEGQLKLSQNLESGKWFYIDSNGVDDNSIEIKSIMLNNDLRLNVGSSTKVRGELLAKFQVIFLTIFIPLLIFSIFLSVYTAQRFLRPIEKLSKLIKEIRNGNLSSRAQLPLVEDELYELTVTFNDMISQVEYLIEAMKDTLDNVAHDLKTPLARARLASELALKSGSVEELKVASEESIENLDIILNLLSTIMMMSGVNSKTLVKKKEKFQARKIIEEIVELYLFIAEEKNITIKIECSEEAYVFADRLMIRQALANLLDNAIKYSLADTTITISCVSGADEIVFNIMDEGMGISASDIPKIWERLYRADKSRHQKGFGLGLSLVKIFVESNGGTVTVESTEGKGSSFKIILPA
jgi:signal transduction histidine kinase